MKTKLLMLILILGLGITSATLNAQTTTVTVTYVGDSMNTYCPPPVQPWIYVYGTAAGYNTNDSIAVYVNFGDGTDTTIKAPISSAWYFASLYHTYTAGGIYNVQYIATGPDGNADTLIVMGEVVVGDTCGNISGKVYVDVNADCQFNTGDVIIPYVPVELIYNGQTIAWTYSDINGDYFCSAPTGNTYEVKIGNQIANAGYSVSCPLSGQYSVSSLPSTGNDFGLTCMNGFDLQAYAWGQRFRPGVISHIYPYVSNTHCLPVSGQAKLVIDDPRLTYVTAQTPPDQIIGDTLIWNFTNLSNTAYWNVWGTSIGYVKVLTDVNAVLGDSICVELIVTPMNGDVNTSNNTFVFCKEISNSYDPNEKHVSPAGVGANGNVAPNTEFTYTIQFQNTGTDTAYNIFILDTLDGDVDLNTFRPIASSHAMQYDILPGNILKFNFSNIMLVDSFANEPLSHGWVSYKISAKSGLINGTQIENTAGIYFDFNAPVITNTTINTVDISLGMNENEFAQSKITVYPNPANAHVLLTLSEKQIGSDLILVNTIGQIVIQAKTHQKDITLDVRNLPSGIYNLMLNNGNENASTKLEVIK